MLRCSLVRAQQLCEYIIRICLNSFFYVMKFMLYIGTQRKEKKRKVSLSSLANQVSFLKFAKAFKNQAHFFKIVDYVIII